MNIVSDVDARAHPLCGTCDRYCGFSGHVASASPERICYMQCELMLRPVPILLA